MTRKLYIILALLLAIAQGAWAFSGSGTSESPYLIANASDWSTLASNVNSGTNYVGKSFRLTNDISVTTMVGNSESNSFQGTFDGDGHTLTISYNTTSDYTAPFRYIQGATFKNLKVTGSITTTMNLAAGIAGLNTNAVANFEQCVTDVTINSSSTTVVGWGRVDYHGGLLARTNSADVYITDCVCGGSVNGSNGPSSTSYCAGFVGVAVGCTVTGTRCLNTTSYTNVNGVNSLCHTASAERSASCFYYVTGNDGYCPGTQVTLSDLENSSYATALQAGRSTTVWIQYAAIHQPMLKLFALNQANDGYYLIGSEQEWRNFASLIETIPTANARMTADISVATMVGSSEKPFSGIFDGDGYTLTVNYNSTAQYAAPFSYADGATFKNLHIAGSITSSAKYVASFVGYSYGSNTFLNCRSSVAITSSITGDGTHGGFVGILEGDNVSDYTVTFEGCVFNGKLLGSNTTNCGGFVGWSQTHRKIRINLSNCLYAPQEVTISISGCQTFSRGQVLSDIFSTNTNNYYIESLGGTQGKQARSISAGSDVTAVANAGEATVYDVSGITSYGTGILYNGVLYAGNGDVVSLNLSHDDNPGSTFSHYVVTGGGSFDDATSNTPTLTMTNANQVINARWAHTLSQATDNSSFISANNGLVYDITLGRTMNAGGWNTFCVPFDISSSQITSKFGSGTEVRELGSSAFNSSTKELTLNFTVATNIEAGKPYLVYLGSNSNVVNPTFNDVTVVNSTTTTETTYANFVPVMNPTELTGSDKTVLFVTGGNKLTYPNATGNINGFRAYFQLHDLPTEARSFAMSFDDETTSIELKKGRIEELNSFFDLQGRKVEKPTKGLYIVNGRKVIVN